MQNLMNLESAPTKSSATVILYDGFRLLLAHIEEDKKTWNWLSVKCVTRFCTWCFVVRHTWILASERTRLDCLLWISNCARMWHLSPTASAIALKCSAATCMNGIACICQRFSQKFPIFSDFSSYWPTWASTFSFAIYLFSFSFLSAIKAMLLSQ